MDTAAILTVFRAIAPEFTVTVIPDDAAVAEFSLVADFVSEPKFGPFYNKAVALYAAHLLKLNEVATDDGAASGAITAGNIVMEKEGDLQRQYGASTSTSAADEFLSKTLYGKLFLQLRSMCIVPAMTRMG